MKKSFLKMMEIPERTVGEVDNVKVVNLIRKGFDHQQITHFFGYTGKPLSDWSKVLPISKRTLERKISDKGNRVKGEPAEAIIESAEIYEIGINAFDGSIDRLNEWLETANPYLGGNKPFSIMDTHHGRDMVKDELTRIEYGAFA